LKRLLLTAAALALLTGTAQAANNTTVFAKGYWRAVPPTAHVMKEEGDATPTNSRRPLSRLTENGTGMSAGKCQESFRSCLKSLENGTSPAPQAPAPDVQDEASSQPVPTNPMQAVPIKKPKGSSI
jgi:hypothetical protein